MNRFFTFKGLAILLAGVVAGMVLQTFAPEFYRWTGWVVVVLIEVGAFAIFVPNEE